MLTCLFIYVFFVFTFGGQESHLHSSSLFKPIIVAFKLMRNGAPHP